MTNLNTGRPPSPNRRRRNATVPTVPLPVGGRPGAVPAWPLGADIVTRARLRVAEDKVEHLEQQIAGGKPVQQQLMRVQERVAELRMVVDIQSERELELWRELWVTPQAVAWERLGWNRTVAQFARWEVLGESGDMDAAREARQLSDRLGLTPLSMLRLRWEVVDEAPVRRTADGGTATVTDMASRRSRLS
jgi:hypothetical protein